MSEAVTIPSLMMLTSIVFEESLALHLVYLKLLSDFEYNNCPSLRGPSCLALLLTSLSVMLLT